MSTLRAQGSACPVTQATGNVAAAWHPDSSRPGNGVRRVARQPPDCQAAR
jgi:hypothetical protein